MIRLFTGHYNQDMPWNLPWANGLGLCPRSAFVSINNALHAADTMEQRGYKGAQQSNEGQAEAPCETGH